MENININTSINQCVASQYEKLMNPCQLEILVKRTLEVFQHNAALQKKISTFSTTEINDLIKKEIENLVVSSKSPWQPTVTFSDEDQKLAYDLTRGKEVSLRQLFNTKMMSALFWNQDPKLFGKSRALISALFNDMFHQLKEKKLSDAENFHMEVIIGDLLSIYPFLGPCDGELLEIPQLIGGSWQLTSYKVSEICLTPNWMGSPIVAYGLTSSSGVPIFLFKGTTYPSDKGASLSILTDLNPFASVGGYAFAIGKNKIEEWLTKNCSNQKALIYGKSLGGALAWRAAINLPSKISKVMAYGAPGFFPQERSRLQELADNEKLPEIHCFCQTNDPVPYSDLCSTKGINYYEIVSGRVLSNPFVAHATMYSAHEHSSVLKMHPHTIQNRWKRIALTVSRLAGSVLFFGFLALHLVVTCVRYISLALQHGIKWIRQNF